MEVEVSLNIVSVTQRFIVHFQNKPASDRESLAEQEPESEKFVPPVTNSTIKIIEPVVIETEATFNFTSAFEPVSFLFLGGKPITRTSDI